MGGGITTSPFTAGHRNHKPTTVSPPSAVSPRGLENLLIQAGLCSKNSRPLTPAYLFITGKVFLSWILSHRDMQRRAPQCSVCCKCTRRSSSLMERDLQKEPPTSGAASHRWQWLSLNVGPTSRISDAWSASPASALGCPPPSTSCLHGPLQLGRCSGTLHAVSKASYVRFGEGHPSPPGFHGLGYILPSP